MAGEDRDVSIGARVSQLFPTPIERGGTGGITEEEAVANLGFTQDIEIVNSTFSSFKAGTIYFIVSGTSPDFTLTGIHYEAA